MACDSRYWSKNCPSYDRLWNITVYPLWFSWNIQVPKSYRVLNTRSRNPHFPGHGGVIYRFVFLSFLEQLAHRSPQNLHVLSGVTSSFSHFSQADWQTAKTSECLDFPQWDRKQCWHVRQSEQGLSSVLHCSQFSSNREAYPHSHWTISSFWDASMSAKM